jgi:DNA-directed RNA polymerase subunit RPC12/RpoP
MPYMVNPTRVKGRPGFWNYRCSTCGKSVTFGPRPNKPDKIAQCGDCYEKTLSKSVQRRLKIQRGEKP